MPTIDQINAQTKEVTTRWESWGEWYQKLGQDLDMMPNFLAKLIENKYNSLGTGVDKNGYFIVYLKPISNYIFKSLTPEQAQELKRNVSIGQSSIQETIENRAVELYNEGVANGYIEAIPE
jgi:hypothetical protein